MGNNDQPSAPAVQEIHVMPVDETRKPSFWISQLFILLATVLGVYLASSQGFKQALAYGEAQAARNNYHLRLSLRNEIADNLVVLEHYMEGLSSGAPSARQAPLNLDTFVWDCLKNSPNTLETPTGLLRRSRRFYIDVEDIHGKISGATYAPGFGKQQLQNRIDAVRNDLLPQFDKDLAELRQYLKGRGVEVR